MPSPTLAATRVEELTAKLKEAVAQYESELRRSNGRRTYGVIQAYQFVRGYKESLARAKREAKARELAPRIALKSLNPATFRCPSSRALHEGYDIVKTADGWNCHRRLDEGMSHERMREVVERVISEREANVWGVN
jgi:hypothetical protein